MVDRDSRAIQRDAAHRTLTALEKRVQEVIQAALDRLADEFARQALHAREALDADELTAQAGDPIDPLDLSRITILWDNQLATIVTALGVVYDEAAAATFARFGATDTARAQLAQAYLEQAENRLREVGETLWELARTTLAEGSQEGLSTDELRRRLQETFAQNGDELGETRAEAIARTETVSAWNTATNNAINAIPEDERPTYKTWLATLDLRTRPSHARVDGATIPIGQRFTVGGASMARPGDLTGPPEEVINCRCVLVYGYSPEPPPDDDRQFLSDDQIQRVLDTWEDRGIVRDIDTVTAAVGHTSGMIALVPSDADLDRLALDGGEPRDELHLTLAFLGDAADIPAEVVERMIFWLTAWADHEPVVGNAFAANWFNPTGEEPAWVLGVGGEDLLDAHLAASEAIDDAIDDQASGWSPPTQHAPWVAHVTLAYDTDPALVEQLADRVGDITFDRIRLALGDDVTDIPLGTDDTTSDATPRYTQIRRWQRGPGTAPKGRAPMPSDTTLTADATTNRAWSTPGDRAIAFEDTETGDGRIFAPGSLYWENEGNGWPLRGNENLDTHDDAALIGSIDEMGRDGRRIPARGVLYGSDPIGAKVIGLLEEEAPLGISVDLDDVSFEVRYRGADTDDDDGGVIILASAASMSVLTDPDGQHTITASGVMWGTDNPTSTIPVALSENGMFTASAGDTDSDDGEIIFQQHSGDEIMRVTRARVRGATTVSLPAYSPASIALDDAQGIPSLDRDQLAASGQLSDLMLEIIDYVQAAPEPVRPGQVANAVGVDASKARTYLVRAVDANRLRRVGRGLYAGMSDCPEAADVTAAVVGDVDLPIHDDPNREWDSQEAASRVLEWATNDDGDVDASRLAQAFLYRDDDANPATLSAYKLPFTDVFDGNLRIVRSGVHATAGGRGVDRADIPEEQKERIRSRICGLYERLADTFEDDEGVVCPWDRDDDETASLPAEVEASAWHQFQALPPLPAAWFAEPTLDELPPDSGGVHVTAEGRIYGWVVQHGVPHDGYSQTLTLDHLLAKGDIDTTHFLRRKRELDDGTFVNVGAFTMNVGHHRDGGECETAACQFDDTRTVAGIVTVGINDRGMWFSGAAAPWLSAWDMEKFATCQPSYRVRQLRDGRYSLRAVLSVPMPGHPSALAASAMALRADMAIAASAEPPAEMREPHFEHEFTAELEATEFDYNALAVAIVDEQERREAARAEIEALAADIAPISAELEVAALAADVNATNETTNGDE